MSDNKPESQSGEQSYTPASPVKRALAWIGVVYMVILVALMTYFYFTATMLGGLGPLLTIPGLVGLGIVSIISHRTTGRPGKGASLVLAVLCWLVAVLTLPVGIAGLMSNFV